MKVLEIKFNKLLLNKKNMTNNIQTVQRVSFTSIATILIPLGVGAMSTNIWFGLTCIVAGILSLVAREHFKVI